MVRITNESALAQIQQQLLSLGGEPLDISAGLIVITPAQFDTCLDAAREGAHQRAIEEFRKKH